MKPKKIMKRKGWVRSLLVAALGSAAVAAASLSYVNDPGVLDNGGGDASSQNYALRGVIGQSTVGVSSSPNYIQSVGFVPMILGSAGSVLFSDSFTEPSGPPANWAVLSGTWAINANTLEHESGATTRESIEPAAPTIANAWIEVKVTVPSGTPLASVVFRAQNASLDGSDQYFAQLDFGTGKVLLRKNVGGVESVVASTSFPLAPGTTYDLNVQFAGDHFRILLGDAQVLAVVDSSLLLAGYYGLQVENGSLVQFDDFSVTTVVESTPVANAGPDQTLIGSQAVLLNGTASQDDQGDPLNYAWTQTGGPPVALSNPNSAAPTFSAIEGNTYTFQLQVDDFFQTSTPSNVSVKITPPPIEGGGSSHHGGGGCGLLGLEVLLTLAALRRAGWAFTRDRATPGLPFAKSAGSIFVANERGEPPRPVQARPRG